MDSTTEHESANSPKHACLVCARRKVKCDKQQPCSNCCKAQARCIYEIPSLQRPRKRAADEELMARIQRYEGLMRKHNVDFTGHANTWVVSGVEDGTGSKVERPQQLSEMDHSGPSKNESPSEVSVMANSTRVRRVSDTDQPVCSWSTLSRELKYPPIKTLYHKDDPIFQPAPALQTILSEKSCLLQTSFPEPRHIYKLWHIFLDRVNPLTKIVHAPTLQERIMEATWDKSKISNSLAAVMFAIFALAVASLSSEACEASFNESRDVLVSRYRTATLRALVEAEFLTSESLEVLQAFYLFLLSVADCDLAFTLVGSAIRVGQKMGLHQEESSRQCSVFEKELGVRLWWQLRGLDARIRMSASPTTRLTDFIDIRPPLNVNDVDLHPEMTQLPVEHQVPTEMTCVLLKLELTNWIRSSASTAKTFQAIIHQSPRAKVAAPAECAVFEQLEAIYGDKFLRKLDIRIPLHDLADTLGKLAIARMVFKARHPRRKEMSGVTRVLVSQNESNVLFQAALRIIQMGHRGSHGSMCPHIFRHMTSRLDLDAYIYVLSELRNRPDGSDISAGWQFVGNLFDEHPELLEKTDASFYSSLCSLSLEAWETRKAELVTRQGQDEAKVTPAFIRDLKDLSLSNQGDASLSQYLTGDDGFGASQPEDWSAIDWRYWDDFLRL